MSDRELGRSRRIYDDACGTALALEFIGERWSLLVMRELVYGPRRFGEIRVNLPGISANVLTQRLESLEEAGIVARRRLPSPANVQVYELTPWGLDAAPLIRDLGHWAARSPRHDPMAFMSAASAMMSLETLVDRERLPDADVTVAFEFTSDKFLLRIADGAMRITRVPGVDPGAADVVFTGDTMALRRTVYGKEGVDAPGLLTLAGDPARAAAFVGLFALPEKVAAPG